MAEEKRIANNGKLIGNNSVYSLTGLCYTLREKNVRRREESADICWVHVATSNPKMTGDGKVLIFQIDMQEHMDYQSILVHGTGLGVPPTDQAVQEIDEGDNHFSDRPGKTVSDEQFTEFQKVMLNYVEMHKQLGSYYPDCKLPYLNCILDMVMDGPVVYIVTKYEKYEYPDYTEAWVLPEILRGLQFFHSHGFVYKYISQKTIFLTENKEAPIQFGFGNKHRWLDPMFMYRLISQANYKSDMWCLGVCFLGVDSDMFPDPEEYGNLPIDRMIGIFNRIKQNSFDIDVENPDPYSIVIARMTCFFDAVRPTAEQALWIIENGQDHPDLPTVQEHISHIKYAQKYLEDNKYCPHIEELTVYTLLDQDYMKMYEKADKDNDQIAMDLIVNSPFAENVRTMVAERIRIMAEILESMESRLVYDPEHPEKYMKMMDDLYDKNLPGLIGKFV